MSRGREKVVKEGIWRGRGKTKGPLRANIETYTVEAS